MARDKSWQELPGTNAVDGRSPPRNHIHLRDSAGTETAANFPSYEDRLLARENVRLHLNTRWALNGPLESSISIASDYFIIHNKVLQPYFQGPRNCSESAWHPLSQSPLSGPKVSSLQLGVEPLDEWDTNWMENHDCHTDPDGTYDPAEVLYGPLPDANEYEKQDEDHHLLLCCGEKRPWGRSTPLIKIEATTEDFVTIHDFISVAHPFLMSKRNEILQAMGEDPGRFNRPFSPETKLMVDWREPRMVDVMDEAEWLMARSAFKVKRAVVGAQNSFYTGSM
ncbi:hypothetical protein B0T16DRAFT_385681 [Cercophora newfieldiana]|uniref:Uncharacterized protein n=1 Tax=Cercophora newfieldiana TaxID=92897 RepID=A0AA39YTB8_9PEZI|nr:hypothetical protein B0T16DRAFT_385681 [Cercophora newfieldiana]